MLLSSSSNPHFPMAEPSLTLTLGPLVVGYTIACILYGMTTVQTYWYFKQFPGDSNFFRIEVVLIWLFATAHEFCLILSTFDITVMRFGSQDFLLKSPIVLDVSVSFAGLIAFLVQLLFTYRLWKVANYTVMAAVIVILSMLRMVSCFVITHKVIVSPSLHQFVVEQRWLCVMTWVLGAVIDTTITVSTSYDLLRRRQHAMKRTTRLVDKLIQWTIETGVVTSTDGIAVATVFLVAPNNSIWIGLFFFLSQLYCNSALAVLNARIILRQIDNNIVSNTGPINFAVEDSFSPFENTSRAIAIEMNQVTEIKHDELYDHNVRESSDPNVTNISQ